MTGSTISAVASTATSMSTTTRSSKARDIVMEGTTNSLSAMDRGVEPPRKRCGQCNRRQVLALAPCSHHVLQPPPSHSPTSTRTSSSSSSSALTHGSLSAAAVAAAAVTAATAAAAGAPLHQRPRRISKLKHRAITATLTSFNNGVPLTNGNFSYTHKPPSESASNSSSYPVIMEPPVLSFYGTEPVPLPTRFAHIKRSLAAGHEEQIEASWARLLEALREEVEQIEARGSHIIPNIDFADITNAERTAQFQRNLKRYGCGLVRGVVPKVDAQASIDATVDYLETNHDFKTPPPQDPTCFDFFWSPAQVRTRAHPRVLEAQRFAMSMWDNDADDRMATRFPIAYADRLRIHGANIGGVGPDAAPANSDDANGDSNSTDAQKAALELLGDFTSSTVIAQVDNGSLERWEPDGYGRGGTYEAIFKGEWERYDPWDPTFRVSSTPDLYNGYGACSIFRMYQGVIALSTIDPGLIRLLPSPKLATAYFLLRPFFSPKNKPPERRDGPEWEAFLDASNWTLDRDHSTIIHGAVPGHAQRLTELWHPHLHLRRTLVNIPTLQTGDYIIWHPDLAYHITSNPNVMASRAPSPPPMGGDDDDDDDAAPPSRPVSVLVYVPAAPLTQTNALYLARQRKTFQRGHPGPDFDSTGSGLGSEASHMRRPGETEIAQIGGPAGLQAMGLAPFDVAPTPPSNSVGAGETEDVEMNGTGASSGVAGKSVTRAEAEVARLANIILFPDRYDFYMGKRNGTKTPRVKAEVVKVKVEEEDERR